MLLSVLSLVINPNFDPNLTFIIHYHINLYANITFICWLSYGTSCVYGVSALMQLLLAYCCWRRLQG